MPAGKRRGRSSRSYRCRGPASRPPGRPANLRRKRKPRPLRSVRVYGSLRPGSCGPPPCSAAWWTPPDAAWPPMGGSRLPRPSRPAAAVRGVMRGRLAAHPAILHRVTVATIASFIGARRRRHRPPRRRSRTAKAAGQFRDSRLLTCSRGALAQEQPHSQRRLSPRKIWT